VVPLAWLYVAIAMLVSDIAPQSWWPHFLFYANLPPQDLVPVTEHMWSLCVEVQFYVGIALWYALTGVRGLWVLPVVALGFTSLRVWNDVYASSLTIDCIDQILAGCVLALVWHGWLGTRPVEWLKAVPQWLVLLLLVVSCFDVAKVYLLRPYLAAILVGTTLVNPEGRLANWLKVRPLVFVAGISYALYVIHPMLSHGWLGSGDLVEKYAKRPLLFAALFALAYLSTRYYERRWVSWGKRLIDGAKPAMR
jgi:peptidoglycan/LPS O-acetylase OafA/YrhL